MPFSLLAGTQEGLTDGHTEQALTKRTEQVEINSCCDMWGAGAVGIQSTHFQEARGCFSVTSALGDRFCRW